MDGLGIETRWWSEVFRTRLDLLWGPLVPRVPGFFIGRQAAEV